jgi:hypothetical protein
VTARRTIRTAPDRTEIHGTERAEETALAPPALWPSPSKAGGRLCAPLLSAYWREVQAAAGLRFDWYMASKHKCVHYMKVKLNLPNHVIAAQMGWSESAVEKMVQTYAHTEIGALDAIDAAFATVPDANATPLGDGAAQLGAVDHVSPPL